MVHAVFRLRTLLQSAVRPGATGIAYYLVAVVSLYLTRGGNGVATLWPSSGILLAALLVAPPRRAGWHVAAGAIASLLANISAGNALTTSLGFTAANMAASSFTAWLLLRLNKSKLTFTDPGGLPSFGMAAMFGAMASATIATIVASVATIGFWLSWFATDLLGILVVTPLLLIVHDRVKRGRPPNVINAFPAIAVTIGMVTAVAILTFSQSSYPLLFLPMLGVVMAVYRHGPLGAAVGVLIVAAISTVALHAGSGPATLVDADAPTRSLFLQFYLIALFSATLPVAALLAVRETLLDQLAEKMRLLQLAESAAHVGHWRLDTRDGTIEWSHEVFQIHGILDEVPPALDAAIEAYHPDDRALVSERLNAAIRDNCGFAFTARIVRPDGEIRHVFSRGEIDSNTSKDSPGLFGIIQDITVQVEHEATIEAARRRAECAAAQATIMAETDPLTGIANRRRTSFAMEQAVHASRASGKPVSIAMFDVDHFKRINDVYGHHVGDEVLKRIAADAGGELRAADTLGRFGGEEFVVVLPDATASIAMSVAERIRAAIEAGGTNPLVTISIGVAELAIGEDCETMLRRADQALYVAKREGRNSLRLAA